MRRGTRADCLVRLAGIDDVTRRLMPFAAIVDVAASVDGAEDRVGAGRNPVYLFDDHFDSATEFHAAKGVEASGVGVAIDVARAGEIVFRSDLRRTAPIQESGFDFLAIGMTANDALARVALGRRFEFALRQTRLDSRTIAVSDFVKFSL